MRTVETYVDIRDMHLNLGEWNELIDRSLSDPDSEPILNLERDEDPVYDAVFIGGGAGGRFGAAYMKAMGGRPLIIDAWPFLGGSCPHQACVPHHLFSEAAEELDRMRWFSDELFFPKFDPSRASILELVRSMAVPLPYGQTVDLTVSVGVAHAPTHASDVRALYAAADEALYRAKRGGRDRVGGCGPAESPLEAHARARIAARSSPGSGPGIPARPLRGRGAGTSGRPVA